MFPDMEAEVIEAVLSANNGAVDATVDHLLAMTPDNKQPEDIEASTEVRYTQEASIRINQQPTIFFCSQDNGCKGEFTV